MKLAFWGLCAGALHAVQAVVVVALVTYLDTREAWGSRTGVFPLSRVVTVWELPDSAHGGDAMQCNMTGDLQNVPAGVIDVRCVVAFFLCISATWQGCTSTLDEEESLALRARVRVIEYGVSASVMIMAIAVEVGVTDVYVLVQSCCLTCMCMCMGLVADIASAVMEDTKQTGDPLLERLGAWAWTAPHALGWVAMTAAWFPIVDGFRQSQLLSVQPSPGFVYAIVCVETILFAFIGATQTVALSAKTVCAGSHADRRAARHVIDRRAEFVFIALCFLSKSLLSWLILAPILVAVG